MKLRTIMSVALMAALAACGTQPNGQAPNVAPVAEPDAGLQATSLEGMPADGQIYPDGNTFRLMALEELPIIGVTTSSSSSGYSPPRMVDGDLSTQWVDGGYRNASSWAAVELAASATIGSIDIKTGPSPAATSYDVQVSSNGTSWTTVRTGLTNTTWNLENKTLPSGITGKFVRILWKNSSSSPQPHFSIFELNVNGEGTAPASPTPTSTPSPVTTASPTAPPSSPPSGTPVKVSPTTVTASSTYSGLTPQRATDGALSTQWSNGGYREASAFLRLGFANSQTFSSLRIKTGALPAGVTYVVEVSDDGNTWASASGSLTNTTWNLETKAISGTGKFLRVRFNNSTSAPIARFSIFEVEAFTSSQALACESASFTGYIYEPGAPAGAPPTYSLDLGLSKHDDTPFGSLGTFNLSYATASGYYEGVAFSLNVVGSELTVGGTATLVDNFGRNYVGEWTLKAQIQRGVNNDFFGKVTSLTVGGQEIEIDLTRAPEVTGSVGDCAPDPRTCFSITNDSALLFPTEGSNEPHGELLINNLTQKASGTSGSITFSGYDGRPNFTGTIQGAHFSGDIITFGGPITGGGNFTFSGIVHGTNVSAPESWELAPLDFKATDAAGNPLVTIEPGTIQPSLTGGFATFLGCN